MSSSILRLARFGLACAALASTVPLRAQAPPAAPTLSRELLSPGEDTVVTVPRWGRYAVLVESQQGAGLQWVDRMSGPGASAGEKGRSDGRLDLLLERGSYKVRADIAEGDQARVRVVAFTEKSGTAPPQLTGERLVRTELEDFEQRSYWIVADGAPVLLDAAGRNLVDMRVWRDGSWLEPLSPTCATVEAEPGRPLNNCQLVASLEPGLYLLSLYGGAELPWTEGPSAHPLYLRSGIPRLPEAGRAAYQVSPFGIDRYIVPGKTRYLRLELPQAERATLSARPLDAERPFRPDGRSAAITTESRVPVAELSLQGPTDAVVSVSGRSGQRYTLQHFAPATRKERLSVRGGSWVATLHSGFPADNLDATGLVVHTEQGMSEVVAADALVLHDEIAWKRRFNLTGRATLYLEVKEEGDFAFRNTGAASLLSIDPVFHNPPAGFKAMEPTAERELRLSLDPGFYVLTLLPTTPGVGELEIRAAGAFDRVIDAVGLGAASTEVPKAGLRFAGLDLSGTGTWTLYVGEQPEVQLGLVQRTFPLDLSEALPLALRPGESVRVPARVTEAGVMVATTDAGRPLRVSVDGGTFAPGPKVKAGDHWIEVKNEGAETVQASLLLRPSSRDADAPLPALSGELLAALPAFPTLDASAPRFADLGVGESTTWQVSVDAAGLYAVRSTGLLATRGTVRTRTVPAFRSDSEGGPGRNFEVLEYLGEGEYQLTVAAQGRTQGHLGVELARATLHEGGELLSGVPARAEVMPGEGVLYTFHVDERAEYRVRSFGLGRSFRCRLEDGEGWPILVPGQVADLRVELAPGDYRLIVLPEPEAGRRISLVERVDAQVELEGHGPHPLALDRERSHVWREPMAGEERAPDVWIFEMPASADVALTLSGDMQGELFAPDGQRFARSTPGEVWQGRLFAGSWRLEVRNSRRDNGVRYTVRLQPAQLLAGMERELTVPAQVPLAVGAEGLYELGSIGGTDVRARLYDAAGTLLADVDDRPLDFNFRLVQRLDPGDYTLRLDPVAVSLGSTRVSMRARVEKEQPALRLPAVLSVVPGDSVQLIPLVLPENAEILALALLSTESMGASLEAKVGGRWRTVTTAEGPSARLEARLGGGAQAWRLRLWSLDLRGNPVELRVDALRAARVGEAALGRGITAGAASKSLPPIAALQVNLDRPGVFRAENPGENLRWCPVAGEGCVPTPVVGFPEPSAALWLVARGDLEKRLPVAVGRVVLEEGEERVVLSGRGAVALDLGAPGGGPVVALVRGAGGQPGASVQSREAAAKPAASDLGMAVGEASALAVGLGVAKPSLIVWSADGQPNEVVAQRTSFAPLSSTVVSASAFGDSFAPGQGRAYALPRAGTLRLVLDEGMVAVLSDERGVRSVHWAERGVTQERVYGARGTLTVLHPGWTGVPASFFAELLSDELQPATLSALSAYEELSWEGGRVRLPIAPGPADATLHVRAAGSAATLVRPDGSVARGPDLPVGAAGGTLILDCDPGLMLLWIDRPGEEGRALWANAEPTSARTVALPARLTLSGATQRLRLAPTSAGLLRLRSGAPLVVALHKPGAAPEVHALQAGGALDLWLPASSVDLDLRGLAGAPLWGPIELGWTEASPLGEGLGPEALLAAGDTRLYRFTVRNSDLIGFGVRASGDHVGARLLDASGRQLASGLTGMLTLNPGEYLLAVHVPPGEAPVRIQPALYGIEPPSSGPPPEVIRGYMELAGLTPVEE